MKLNKKTITIVVISGVWAAILFYLILLVLAKVVN